MPPTIYVHKTARKGPSLGPFATYEQARGAALNAKWPYWYYSDKPCKPIPKKKLEDPEARRGNATS